MSSLKLTQFAGMVTAPGLLERNEASCIDALNWEFPAPGLIRKRRGFARQAGNAGGPVWALMTSRLLGNNLLAHVGTATEGTNIRYGDGSAALTAIPTIDTGALTRDPNPATGTGCRMHLAVCQRNHYLTADQGVARVESDYAAGGPARYAGMPRGLGLDNLNCIVLPGAGQPFGAGYARAYRITWHRKDADGVELGGAPSARWLIANAAYTPGYTGGVAAFGMYIDIPAEFGTQGGALTTAYFYRLWGTRTFLEATELGDDEMHLVTEQYLTAADIINGNVSPIDSTPDRYLLSSPTLHTNLYNFPPSEVGIRQGVVNEDAPPPSAGDIAYWQDVMWYADCRSRASFTVSMVSAPADGDTVILITNGGTVTLRAKLAPALATDYLIEVAGPTTAINLRLTAIRFAAKVRQHCAASGLSCHHVSTSTTEPAMLYFEQSRLATGPSSAIGFNPSNAAVWHMFGGAQFATNIEPRSGTNEMRWSKPLRADAVPPINVLSVGPADSRILRIMPLRDRLIVFTDYGIYQVTGRTFADFAAFPLDLGFRLIGRELVAQCDEKLYAWCAEGIVEIDDGGVRVVSTPIEPTIEAALVTMGGAAALPLSAGRSNLSILGFAVAYRNQHQVRFHYPGAVDLTLMYGSHNWLSFDTRTRAWARGNFGPKQVAGYDDGRSCAVVRHTDDLLSAGSWSTGADTYLFLERRGYVAGDFVDDDRTGGSAATHSTLRFQYQVPDARGAQHWQQTLVNWDAEEISWRPLPTSIRATHTTEEGSATDQLVTVSELATRIEVPQGQRRGQRLAVTLEHSAAEYAGIVGVVQDFRGGTKFARKVTP